MLNSANIIFVALWCFGWAGLNRLNGLFWSSCVEHLQITSQQRDASYSASLVAPGRIPLNIAGVIGAGLSYSATFEDILEHHITQSISSNY